MYPVFYRYDAFGRVVKVEQGPTCEDGVLSSAGALSLVRATNGKLGTSTIGTVQTTIDTALSTIATAVNTAVLATGGPTEQLMTLALIGVNLETGETSYLNAGHQPIIHVSETCEVILQSGNPLGLSAEENFGRRNFVLKPRDMLVIFSDGLVENRDEHGQRLKLKALRRIVGEAGAPEGVIAKVREYVAVLPRNAERDDTACLTLRWLGAGERE